MRRTEIWFLLLSLVYQPCYPANELANTKIVMNRTGSPVYFMYYSHKSDPTYRFPQSFTYYLLPDTIQMPAYPGTLLRGISWDPVGTTEHYVYGYSDINRAVSIILHPRGRIELH